MSVNLDSMIMVTLVQLVLITVLLVKTEKPVYLAQSEEIKVILLVNVTLVSMILVKLNVKDVNLDVLPVIETPNVSPVPTQPGDYYHTVTV